MDVGKIKITYSSNSYMPMDWFLDTRESKPVRFKDYSKDLVLDWVLEPSGTLSIRNLPEYIKPLQLTEEMLFKAENIKVLDLIVSGKLRDSEEIMAAAELGKDYSVSHLQECLRYCGFSDLADNFEV